MDYRYIEQLLQRYFDCETTTQEEAILRTFFSQDEIPSQLMPYANVFKMQAELKGEQLSAGFEARVMQKIESRGVYAQRLSLQRRLSPLYKAAAGVAIVLSLGLAASQGFETHDSVVTPSSARPAGEQVSVLPEKQGTHAMTDTMITATPAKPPRATGEGEALLQ